MGFEGYRYENMRKDIFTEETQRDFLAIRDRINELLDTSGAVRMREAIHGVQGFSNWTAFACVDRLVELGEIRELKTEYGDYERVFVRVEKSA